jgi:uncharacterized membrane protein YraQ (UPF0718 family)
MATAPSLVNAPVQSRAQIMLQILALALLLVLLVDYKGAAGLTKLQQVGTSGALCPAPPPGVSATSALRGAIAYLKIIWPALVFGVLISAAVRTSVSRTPLQRIFEGGAARDQIAAVLAGTPLMLCSCCAAPIFSVVYQHTRRVASALGLTLASPSLNPAALTLTFILFPWRIAGARLAMALVLVFFGAVLVARVARPPVITTAKSSDGEGSTWFGLLRSYGASLSWVVLRTVPLIGVGIWVSMWIMQRLPLHAATNHLLAIPLISAFAVLLALPTFFEIPLALSLLAAGAPAGVAAALLFAGPAINLPSLLVIGRHSSWKTALILALLIWAIALIGGLLLD